MLCLGKCHFLPGGGLLKIGGDQVLFLRSKGGIKRFFQINKGGSLILFKEIKYFVKHFRTQMEFLLILQKRCLSHVGTLQNECKSCNLRAEDTLLGIIHMGYDWHSVVLVI